VKSFEELSKEQAKRENALLSKLMGGVDIEELADFEAELSERQSEILFKITTEIEDTQDALNQVEQLAQRLRRHLERLKKLHQTLSK
jgi:phosphopantetheinyl transferase (holo-ACP synthase)